MIFISDYATLLKCYFDLFIKKNISLASLLKEFSTKLCNFNIFLFNDNILLILYISLIFYFALSYKVFCKAMKLCLVQCKWR